MKLINQSKKLEIPKVQDVNFIKKNNGFIKGYAVNTFHGMAKNYNEDRVSIIMNITKPNYKGKWPKCSYFGVFDGHGGNVCSDYLKDNMHKFITQNQYFPTRPIQALKQGFKNAQLQFLKTAQKKNPIQRSGSCAIVLLIIDQICYVANVGDSRAILSTKSGKHVYAISRDHKPDSENEKARILQAGGNIYQSSIKGKNGNIIYGPYRIQPGKLSVSRSFGDIQAKYPQFGGNHKVLIAKPQITYFTIDQKEHDFIMIGSDGIYDKMQNQEIVQQFWNLQNQAIISKTSRNYSETQKQKDQQLSFVGKVASRIITKAMQNNSLDNLTTLFIIFENNGILTEINPNFSRNYNSSLISSSLENKKQRIKTNPLYDTKRQDSQNHTQFALKRQISKRRVGLPTKFGQLKSKQQEKNIKSNDFNESIQKIIKRKKSMNNLKHEQQNRQQLANLNIKNQSKQEKNSKLKSYSVKKQDQIKPLGSSNNISNNEFGQLKRKKSQISTQIKEAKKQTVWTAISRGIKNNQKVIQKIRY